MSRFLSIILLCGLLGTGVGCSKHEDVWPGAKEGQKRVLTSFPPLYCFAKNVVGDEAAVQSLLTNIGPHDYEANPGDALKVRKADVLFANGLQLDDFVVKLVNLSGKAKTIPVVKVADALDHDMLMHPDEAAHEAMGDDHHHHHGDHDPHVWLSPVAAAKMTEIIAKKLAEIDPGHKVTFQKNASAYIAELKKVHEEGKRLLAKKKNRNVVATHDSLGYFARDFDVKIVGYIQAQPGQEAEAQRLANIIKLCKNKQASVISYEPQYAKKQADNLKNTLAQQGVQVQVIEIDTMETAPPDLDAGFYVRRLRQNLDNLANALPAADETKK